MGFEKLKIGTPFILSLNHKSRRGLFKEVIVCKFLFVEFIRDTDRIKTLTFDQVIEVEKFLVGDESYQTVKREVFGKLIDNATVHYISPNPKFR